MRREKEEDDDSDDVWGWLIVLLFILLLIFIIPILFFQQQEEAAEDKHKSLQSLQDELLKLELLSQKSQEVIRKLDKRFSWQYTTARLSLVFLWVIAQVVIFIRCGWSEGLSVSLSINAYVLSILIVINFALFGKVTDVEQMVERLEMWMRNRVYRKNKNIHQNLLAYDDEKKEIISKIEMTKREIAEMKK